MAKPRFYFLVSRPAEEHEEHPPSQRIYKYVLATTEHQAKLQSGWRPLKGLQTKRCTCHWEHHNVLKDISPHFHGDTFMHWATKMLDGEPVCEGCYNHEEHLTLLDRVRRLEELVATLQGELWRGPDE